MTVNVSWFDSKHQTVFNQLSRQNADRYLTILTHHLLQLPNPAMIPTNLKYSQNLF